MTRVQLKVCGVTRSDDLLYCVQRGVDFIGINLWLESRRGLSLERATAMLREAGMHARENRGDCGFVGVFVDPERSSVLEAVDALGLSHVQYHGPAGAAGHSPEDPPSIEVVRGTPELSSYDFSRSSPLAQMATWTLLDAAVPGYGGHGVETDWQWARKFVDAARPHPVWLAGGITPMNATRAIAEVRPAGLDVASGSELSDAKHGEKDHAKIDALLAACRSGPGA